MIMSQESTTSREDRLKMLLQVLDQNCRSTMALTSRGRLLKTGQPPPLDQMFAQLVANQVAEMQCLREILVVLIDDFGHLLYDSSTLDEEPNQQ
jgi:hypothetical protein